MAAPVILLCYSNARDEYLPTLNREQRNSLRALRYHDDRGAINVKVVNATTLEDIFEYVNEYKEDLHIFHYAGHAGGHALRLETQAGSNEAAHAAGLATLLGGCPNLRLVCLNGCATHGFVQKLFDEGVKLVLATRSAIADIHAAEFAEQFFNSLSSHTTLDSAAKIAFAFLRSRYNEKFGGKQMRGLVLREKTREDLPWGLYHNPSADVENALQWHIPTHKVLAPRPIPPESKVNEILIETIFNPVAQHSRELVNKINDPEVTVDDIKRELFDSFPLPIGEQLRKLLARSDGTPDPMEGYTLDRLKQVIRAYRMTVKFVCHIMLSQLWDEKHANFDMKISEDYLADFNGFLTLSEATYESYGYIKLIAAIADLFDDYNIEYFIEELDDVRFDAQNDPTLYEAIVSLNNFHEAIRNHPEDLSDMREVCLQAERDLGEILKAFAFLVKYKLRTIKNIEIIKSKHMQPKFRHSQVRLSKALTLAVLGEASDMTRDYENFTDSKCVIFIKEKDGKVNDYLNLSPFIIDENALASQKSTKLHTLLYHSPGELFYEFIGSTRDEPLNVNTNNYPVVFEEFSRFKAEVFGMISGPKSSNPDLLDRLKSNLGA